MKSIYKTSAGYLARVATVAFLTLAPAFLFASSHMDAPLIILDPAANTTDVYAFVSGHDGQKYLTAALAVYPFEEPGIGPNKYNFDDNVHYAIHVSTGADVAAGRPTYTYEFNFHTNYKSQATILQSYLGVVQNVDDASQNLTQTYTLTRIDHRHKNHREVLGTGKVPPNNQGIATPFYNVNNDGDLPARDGVGSSTQLDRYTAQSVFVVGGHRVFAGQREDGFYGDIQSIFDLLNLRLLSKNPTVAKSSFDSQAGFNVHTMVLEIPLSALGGDQQSVGVYATTSRAKVNVLPGHDRDHQDDDDSWFVQVGRQGNPLFCEALVAIKDKDLYNRSSPTQDAVLFSKYASSPELGALINALVFNGAGGFPTTNRTDLVGIFVPDLIKVDLSTAPARLAGGGANHPTNPDDAGFSRLGIFGGDVLMSAIQAGFGGGKVPGGWPNGRRFGDDVIDIAVTALVNDLRPATFSITFVADGIDSVSKNDAVYNKVFPYAGTPFNGRNHQHN